MAQNRGAWASWTANLRNPCNITLRWVIKKNARWNFSNVTKTPQDLWIGVQQSRQQSKYVNFFLFTPNNGCALTIEMNRSVNVSQWNCILKSNHYVLAENLRQLFWYIEDAQVNSVVTLRLSRSKGHLATICCCCHLKTNAESTS